jgi:hypothetical protein
MKRWMLWVIALIVFVHWSGTSTIAWLLWTFILVMALLSLVEFLSEGK